MILESFSQDIRIGVRVLLRDKVFCLLSIIVLALGICGVTTQFTIVNAIVLRGFSFPHPEQLVSVGLLDPQASDQKNNYGVGNLPSTQDYEDLEACATFVRDDGGISQRLDHQRHLQGKSAALHRRICDRRVFQNHRRLANPRARFYRLR